MQPEYLDRYAWMYVQTVVNNLGPFVRGITILRPEIRDWGMKTYLQMKWRGTHQGHIMKLLNHQYIYFWLKISKYSRPHVEIKFLKEQKKRTRDFKHYTSKWKQSVDFTFIIVKKNLSFFLQNNSLPQSKKKQPTTIIYFFTISRGFKKFISYDKDCVAFLAPVTIWKKRLKTKNVVWLDT